jgi:hypothetical protein
MSFSKIKKESAPRLTEEAAYYFHSMTGDKVHHLIEPERTFRVDY